MSNAALPAASSHAAVRRKGYIVSPWYDLTFFILSPVLALALGIMISGSEVAHRSLMLGGYSDTLASCVIGVFIMAHLFAVFFRSHLNRAIFRTHPWRFTVVPLTLFMLMNVSPWLAVSVTVLAVWWDVYHSSLQTFGIGRIYDLKQGNDVQVGRQLDRWLNLYLYAGPILAGATLADHLRDFQEFRRVDSVFFSSIPALVESNSRYLTWGVLLTGIPFFVIYCWCYWRYAQQGYNVSVQKIALLVSTGLVSIYTWGFNTFGEAFFIMNFFHAWQYFAIVWWSERKNLTERLRLSSVAWGPFMALLLFLSSALAYGIWAEFTFGGRELTGGQIGPLRQILLNLVVVVSVMHFWYDGFIWSVRKRQVQVP